MRIPFKNKLLVLLLLGIMVYVGGCVDTSVQTIPDSVNYTSQVQIVNLVSDGGTATITLNNQSLGTLNLGAEYPTSSFMDIPSGNKVMSVNYSSGSTGQYRFAADTEYRMRVFLIGAASSTEVVKKLQRYVWQTKDSQNGATLFPADTGQVSFFNGSAMASINSITPSGADEIHFDTPLGLGGTHPYTKLPAGNYQFTVLYNDSLETTIDYTLGSKGRYTVIFYDNGGSLQNKVLVDD